MIIGCDLDGVLADFNQSFRQLLRQVSGRTNISSDGATFPDCWSWPTRQGWTRADEDAAWTQVRQSRTEFWARLPAYEDTGEALARLRLLQLEHDVQFITTRVGDLAKLQSEFWLEQQGQPMPTVIISASKGHIAKGLKLDLMIDDKPENLDAIEEHSPNTRRYLMDQPWNRAAVYNDMTRVSGVEAMLDTEGLGRNLREVAGSRAIN